MSRIRSHSRQAAVLAAFALVVGLLPGGILATAQAVGRHRPPSRWSATAPVRWHVLALLNGWKAVQPFDGGAPRVAIKGGVVYLAGAMDLTGSGRQWFATLPRGMRPSHNLWLPIFTATGSAGSLEIAANGRMNASGKWASAFASLTGISFPVRSVRLRDLSLLDGWASSQSEFDSGDPAAGIQNGVVYLAGSMHKASGIGNEVAVLPTALRPPRNMWFVVYTYNGTIGDVMIDVQGRIDVFGGAANAYTSLAGISFPVASVRLHHLRLVNGWASAPASSGGPPRAGVQHGIVYLAGATVHGSSRAFQFATLPRGLRPARNMWMLCYTAGGVLGVLEILSTGQIGAGYGNAAIYTSIAGISFPAGP